MRGSVTVELVLVLLVQGSALTAFGYASSGGAAGGLRRSIWYSHKDEKGVGKLVGRWRMRLTRSGRRWL